MVWLLGGHNLWVLGMFCLIRVFLHVGGLGPWSTSVTRQVYPDSGIDGERLFFLWVRGWSPGTWDQSRGPCIPAGLIPSETSGPQGLACVFAYRCWKIQCSPVWHHWEGHPEAGAWFLLDFALRTSSLCCLAPCPLTATVAGRLLSPVSPGKS